MDKLRDVIRYFLANHPDADRMSLTRLVALVFLADWRSAIRRGRQLTGVEWQFDDLPEISDDFHEKLRLHGEITGVRSMLLHSIDRERQFWNFLKPEMSALAKDDREILDFVIEATSGQSLQDFTRLIKSTYPAVTQPRQESLDLVRLAQQYERDEELFTSMPEVLFSR